MTERRGGSALRFPVSFARYIVFREDAWAGDAAASCEPPAGFDLGYIGAERMDELASLAGRDAGIDDLRARFLCRNLCLAALKDQRIVAFSWASFGLFQFKTYCFPLLESEAYLFDAFTLPEYRGLGLAVVIRRRLHRDLAAKGRTRCYSVTLINNSSALRFKEKMNGCEVDRGFYLRVTKRWTFGSRARPERVRAAVELPA